MIAKTEVNSHKKIYSRITLKIIRADGSIRKVRKYDAHSLVSNLWELFYARYRAENISMTDINGGSDTVFNGRRMTCLGGAGSFTGLIVGTSNNALSVTQTQLSSMVNHGTGAGEMDYSANSILPDTNNRKATISRSFENLSGGTISINEIGLTMNEILASTGPYLIARDVLPATEDVLDTETLAVSYEIFFTKGLKNYQAFFKQIDGGANFAYTNTGGATVNEDLFQLSILAESNNNNYGILVGSGSTPVTFNDFNLDSKIGAGSAPGELNSTPVILSDLSVDAGAGTVSFDIKRSFINNTENPITVNEMGLFVELVFATGDPKVLLDRVVLGAPVTIRAGEQRAAKWLFRYSI